MPAMRSDGAPCYLRWRGGGRARALRTLHLAVGCLAAASCDWVSLAAQALTYEQVGRGEAANLALLDTLLFATAAEDGLTVTGLASAATIGKTAPPEGTQSIDDVAIAGTLLFVLDAVAPGYLSVLSLADPLHPQLVGQPREVPVGPFSGISAADGLVVVSGGTSTLTAWAYDRATGLHGPVATGDVGRGQPDVLLAPGRHTAFVSAHYFGPRFGLDVVRIDTGTRSIVPLARVPLEGAGFTDGGAKPSSFPLEAAMLGSDTVLVAHGGGVDVIDLTGHDSARLVTRIDAGGVPTHLHVLGDTVAVVLAGPSPAVALIDFAASPARTFRRLSLPPGTFPLGVVLAPSRIAVAIRHQGVLILDR